jgi:branched-chain amino acid transport system ATP-binding protein
MSAVLECSELTSGYKGVPAVRDLNLSVAEGEIVALLGPNGAGKTTTLLTIAGVLTAQSGSVTVLGDAVRGGRPHLVARRGALTVPADRALFHEMTAQENVRLGLPRGQLNEGLELVLEYFPALKPRLKVRAGLLSGGEQQMLAIGRALAARPRALMIDELSLGLAPVIVKSMLPIIRRIATELHTAVLLVEQHLELALATADRAYVLSHGTLLTSGPAGELRRDRDLLKAGYLGEVRQPVPPPVNAGGSG